MAVVLGGGSPSNQERTIVNEALPNAIVVSKYSCSFSHPTTNAVSFDSCGELPGATS